MDTSLLRKFGLEFKVSLPSLGCERTHWRTHKWEAVDPAADTGGSGRDEAEKAQQADTRESARRSSAKLQLSDFDLGRVVGEGNYSRVFLGKLKSTGEQMAVKVIDKKKLERYKKQAEALMEKHVLSTCSHPFMIRLHHTFQDRSCLYIVTEYVPGGELWSHSQKTGLRHSLAAFYTAELIDVLEYLHSRQIVHRDVKPENVLLAADGHIKLIDFGTAKVLGEDAKETSGNFKFGKNFKEFVGTPEYMPPEAINNKPSDFRADLWSLGGTIYHLVTGALPFKGGSEYLTFKRVLELKYRCPVGMPEDARDLISKLLRVEPRERLGGGLTVPERHAALRAHPFFEQIDWSQPLHAQRPPDASPAERATPQLAAQLQSASPLELPPPIEMPAPQPRVAQSKKQREAESAEAERAAAELQRLEAAKQMRAAEVAVLVRAGQAHALASSWTEDERRRVAFHLDVRGQLTEELRFALGMPAPEPEIVDEIEPLPDSSDEDEEAAADAEADQHGESGERPPPAAAQQAATVASPGSASGADTDARNAVPSGTGAARTADTVAGPKAATQPGVPL